jgi:hypothetical protein
MSDAKKTPLLSGLLILFLAAMIFANIGGNMYGALMVEVQTSEARGSIERTRNYRCFIMKS